MAKFEFYNIGKANAEISSANEAADAALTAAKIVTLKVDGKDLPASSAPLAAKISALASIAASGEKTQDVSELIASNGQIAAQVEKLETENTTAQATVSAQHQEITKLKGDLATANASVEKLTAEKTQLNLLLNASNSENTRITGLVNANNRELSKMCLAAGVLELNGDDGKALSKDATDEQKLSAAEKVPMADKLKSYQGATNAAMAKLGISIAALPAPGAPSTSAQKPELKGRERMKAAMKIDGQMAA